MAQGYGTGRNDADPSIHPTAPYRMPSLVMEPGQSVLDYYKALQLQAAELNAANAQQVGGERQRRNSGSSVM